MAKFTDEDDALLDELGVEVEVKKHSSHTPKEERVIAGFEEIQRFVEEHRHAPRHSEDGDIFERLYAVRLDRIRELAECRVLVEAMDHQDLLAGTNAITPNVPDDIDDDALLAELGVDTVGSDISELKHVRSSAEKRAADEIANREKCEDFEKFKPLFEQVQADLNSGIRTTREFERKAEISPGRFFIVGGQKAYVAEMDEEFMTAQGMVDARLRVIFDNGTESNILMRSLQRALHRDEAGRRITDPVAGPLFAGTRSEGDTESGTIYVLRSLSDHPDIAKNRQVIHKIGVTGGKVETRINNAKLDPTFLMADVEIIAKYELYNINRTKLENLLHRVFAPGKLDLEIKDRFGTPMRPREWFLVPLDVIDDAVERIKENKLTEVVYDPSKARLVPTEF